MRIRNKLTLGTILLTSALGLTSCKTNHYNPEYHYKGKIGEWDIKEVHFYETDNGWCNILKVTEIWGFEVKFIDENDDFKLDRYTVTNQGDIFEYEYDATDYEFLIAQERFDYFLQKILGAKKTK